MNHTLGDRAALRRTTGQDAHSRSAIDFQERKGADAPMVPRRRMDEEDGPDDSNRGKPGRVRQTFVNRPDWIRSTRTFHSSVFRTARFPASPIRTLSPAISTSGH